MSTLTNDPLHHTASTHRAQIVAEAVTSAYIHEITNTHRTRDRTRSHRADAETRARTRSRLATHTHDRAPAPQGAPSLGLAA